MRLAAILCAWIVYFALHSMLADTSFKAWVARRWPKSLRGYRLFYNVIAIATLLPLLWLVYGSEGHWLWTWQGAWRWLANAIAIFGLLCLYFSSRTYDMDEFLGLSQLRNRHDDLSSNFRISSIHRYVRHPWYFVCLLLIWTRDMNGPLLVSALAVSIYFVIGSRLEERKLVESYGEPYLKYMQAVPGLFPLPWRRLSSRAAALLTGHGDNP